CIPESRNVLMSYVAASVTGADLAFGRLRSSGDSFWSRYIDNVSRRREEKFFAGDQCAFTAANFMCRRSCFVNSGKFDVRYRHYGFEDRDLLIRLVAQGAKAVFVPRAIVAHEDRLNLETVGRKMRAAGRFSSGLFMSSH